MPPTSARVEVLPAGCRYGQMMCEGAASNAINLERAERLQLCAVRYQS
jgi:hypothetical protein